MNYEEWMQLPIEERDRLFNESVEEGNKLSRKIEISQYFIKEGLKELQDKIEELKLWKRLR